MDTVKGVGRLVAWCIIMVLVMKYVTVPWNTPIVVAFVLGGVGAVAKEWWEYRGPRSENEIGDFFTFGDAAEAFTEWWVTPLCWLIGGIGVALNSLVGVGFALIMRVRIPRPSEWLE